MSQLKNALIVGMPRSGTSLTTKIFDRSGYFVAENKNKETRQGDKHNPAGYFEAEKLIEANAEIFAAADYPCHNSWLFDEAPDTLTDAINELTPQTEHEKLLAEYQENAPFVWKDPRLCYSLGYWAKIIDWKATGVLLLIREPDAIYQSFLRLKWRGDSAAEKQDTYRRIDAHIRSARAIIEKYNIPFIEINYADYAKATQETLNKINGFFGTEVTVKQLGYQDNLNHQGASGKLYILVDRIYSRVPAPIKSLLRVFKPRSANQ